MTRAPLCKNNEKCIGGDRILNLYTTFQLTLDGGSLTSDPDNEELGTSHLGFIWSCLILSNNGIDQSACDFMSFYTITNPSLFLTSTILYSGVTYQFILTVSDPSTSRVATANTFITTG